MATITAGTSMATPQRRPRRRTWSARHPAHVLLNVTAVVGTNLNRTTATSTTRNKVPIQVSFLFQRPPQPSTLFVSSSDLNSDDPPEILCSVDDLLLLRVNVSTFPFGLMTPEVYDYFVYRANRSRPSLELLQPPHPYVTASNVGLLPRSDGHYTVAALVPTDLDNYVYTLHRYHSDTSSGWSSSTVSAVGLWKPLPAELRTNDQLMFPHATTVITIGGKRGTMGWVDLWCGILLCDVLDPASAIRGVPLPLPLKDIRFRKTLGYSGFRRGISFVRDTGCLKFVHMDVTSVRLPGRDEETGAASFRMDDWALTMWSNKEMSDSLDDWHEESSVEASKITIDDYPAISQVLKLNNSGLRTEPWTDGSEQRQLGVQNLVIFQLIPCDNGTDVVYLMARKKFMHPMVWMLALEMKNGGRLRSVAYCGHQGHRYLFPTYCPSRISRYLYPKTKENPATVKEELDEAGGLELITME